MKNLLIYISAASLIAAVITLHDKIAAVRGKRRIPERILFLTAALGGGAGMLLTMLVIRHKTKKAAFMIGLPLIVLAHTALIRLAFPQYFLP